MKVKSYRRGEKKKKRLENGIELLTGIHMYTYKLTQTWKDTRTDTALDKHVIINTYTYIHKHILNGTDVNTNTVIHIFWSIKMW